MAPDLLAALGGERRLDRELVRRLPGRGRRPAGWHRTVPFAIGLTEVRLLFPALNTAFHLKPPIPLDIAGMRLGYGDMRGIACVAVNFGLYVMGMIGQPGQPTRDEPPAGKDR